MKLSFSICLLTALSAPAMVRAQQAPAPPLTVAQQAGLPEAKTPEGAVFTVNDAQYQETRDGLQLEIQLYGEDATGAPLKSSFWRGLRAALYAPDGELLLARADGATVRSGDIDPQWKSVTLELWGREPNPADGLSSATADGTEQENLEFELPLPAAGAPQTVNLTRTSALGSQITLESVGFDPKGAGGVVSGTYRVQAPAGAPGTRLVGANPLVLDNNQPRRQISGGGGMETKGDVTTFTAQLSELPADKILRLSIYVAGDIPSKAVAAHRFKTRLEVPLPAAAPAAPIVGDAAFGAKDADVALVPGLKAPWWAGRLVSRSATDSALLYTLGEAQFVSAGGKSKATPESLIEARSRLEGGGWQQKVRGEFTTKAADITSLEGEVEAKRALFTRFLARCPVPAPGQTLALDQEIATATGIELRLIGARYYENLGQVPGAEAEAVPTRGLMFVFASRPSFAPLQSRFIVSDYRDWTRDDLGRPLANSLSLRWRDNNGLTAQRPFQSDDGFFSVYLPAPAPDAQFVEFTATLREFGEPLSKTKFEGAAVPRPTLDN